MIQSEKTRKSCPFLGGRPCLLSECALWEWSDPERFVPNTDDIFSEEGQMEADYAGRRGFCGLVPRSGSQ